MNAFRPALPYAVPARILTASTAKSQGITVKTYADGAQIWVSARGFGGTEAVRDGVLSVVDTMTIETWFRPDITQDCRIRLLDDGSVWGILNLEDVGRRHQYVVLKCSRIAGGA